MNGSTAAIQYITAPTACPSCGGALQRDGEYLVCRNEDCPAQASGAIKRWIKKVGILHFGDTLVETLVEAGMINDIADLYALDETAVSTLDMNGRKVGGTASKALSNLNAKKVLSLHVFVGSLGIPLIGRDMAKMVVDAGFNTLSLMFKARVNTPVQTMSPTGQPVTLPAVASIPGMGQTKAEAFVNGYESKKGLMGKLIGEAGITIATVSGPLVGLSFCMTGFRDADLSDAIEKQGGTMKGSVSKGLTYLIAQDPASTSGKAAKAAQYGVKVIGIDEAYKMAGL